MLLRASAVAEEMPASECSEKKADRRLNLEQIMECGQSLLGRERGINRDDDHGLLFVLRSHGIAFEFGPGAATWQKLAVGWCGEDEGQRNLP